MVWAAFSENKEVITVILSVDTFDELNHRPDPAAIHSMISPSPSPFVSQFNIVLN